MNRSELHRLSNARLREAKALFAAKEYSGSYYLAGYAVECGLKACFAKKVKRYDFPDLQKTKEVYTHKLTDLVKQADLDDEMRAARKANPRFSSAWDIVCGWSERSRYLLLTRNDAERILRAIASRKDGVMPWIKRNW